MFDTIVPNKVYVSDTTNATDWASVLKLPVGVFYQFPQSIE
jgi:hypothetical protein